MSVETVASILAGWTVLSIGAGLVIGRVIGSQSRDDVAWREELTPAEIRPRLIVLRHASADAAAETKPDSLHRAA